ncbi:MAG: phosphoribosylformylglycinamidine synthase subunit PurL [Nitrospinota bacterium]|nr:phosphoribosylformylglycinamidine synthase subunit PurL [Nitrospinota bacterium]
MKKQITPELVEQHGLSSEEYKKLLRIIGREPTFTELGIFSAMWSEHCSYKSSKIHLKKFPTDGPQVIQGPGENAGIVDIGDGESVVFKIESHNHPSFIEPFQGAATGVGGILRDVFTMGARPIASMNSLRFGSLSHPKTKFLLNGVASGIAGYGNCIGVPTIGGEVYFNDCYNGNILVNAFALGIVKTEKIFKGLASGVGNSVMYVGSKTGRDGIHGATMASEEFDENSEERRPTVQVGDPFTEKLLLEACLELMKTDYIVGIQDMGAAGLTSSSFEMADRSGTGIEMDITKIPRREDGMNSYELMLSESQERMLIVVKKGKENEVEKIFNKWDLDAVVVGKVTDNGYMKVKENGNMPANLPIKPLVEGSPLYDRPSKRPGYQDELQHLVLSEFREPENYNDILLNLLASPNISCKEWVYRQYDHMVRINGVILPGSDAAVIRIKGSSKGVGMSLDCNSRYCYLDPYAGGMIAVAEGARNLVCSGVKPLAITNCLNFGNPEKPEIMWQFKESVRGMSDACSFFKTPVVSGNVSFYNETQGVAIYPTPVVGMVGLIQDCSKAITQFFKEDGDVIVLLGETKEELGGSEYFKITHDKERGNPPELILDAENRLHELCLEAIRQELVKSAHDCSEGGLAIAIAECAVSGPVALGAEISLKTSLRKDALLFGESQSRIVLSANQKHIEKIIALAEKKGVPVKVIGKVIKQGLKININSKSVIEVSCDKIKKSWENTIKDYMGN